ncbi:MAG: coproporphyrinogen dehydrogenase HemZ [Clostridia bacterium]|nr:coproporphyrinogen dehydrogenase HemZ [Clostridia bacterium]
MNYCLQGHDRDNGVQEMLISLLPDEPHDRVPELPRGAEGCRSIAWEEAGKILSRAWIRMGEKHAEAQAESLVPTPADGEEYKRILTYTVKTAVYRALLPLLEHKPVWGSLTGVKPAKPARLAIREGMSREGLDAWLRDHYDVSESRRRLCIRAAEYAMEAEDRLLPRETQLYLGIPFCPAKCSYCSFVSNDMARWGHMIEPYTQALLREVEAAGELARTQNIPLGSVYMGGGTPTTLNEDQLLRVLSAVNRGFDLSHCREFTVEAGRPETITGEKLDIMAACGVSRISINPQTMNDAVLRGVGRNHTAADIERCYRMAREKGRFFINMDLIAGLPGDDDAGLIESVRRVAALEPDNITIHCLARKRGARLYFGPTGQLSAETLNACYDHLEKLGYEPYYLYRQKYMAGGLENVGFCKPGTASHYNICMMEELSDVIALGSGGVSKLCWENGRRIHRVANPKYPKEYIERIDLIAEEKRRLPDERQV